MNIIDLKSILLVALVFVPLERVFALRADQRMLRRHWASDLSYLFLNGVPIWLGLAAVLSVTVAGLRQVIPDAVIASVDAQPVWVQAIEVIVLADVGFYLAHRAFHRVPFLWKFHVIHHSIEEMDWLAGHRVHPVDQVLTKAASYLPVLALGFSAPAIAIFGVLYHWESVLIHSNVRLEFGPLKWVLASPRFHHWHHANESAARDRNFAGLLPIMDVLGGTLFFPDRMPQAYGTDEPVPALYHQQILYPFARSNGRPMEAAPHGVRRWRRRASTGARPSWNKL